MVTREFDQKLQQLRPTTCSHTPSPPGLHLDGERVTDADILLEIQGYARVAHTTGGLGGLLRTVTTVADSAPGQPAIPGSLRAFVEEAGARRVAMWIVFDPALGPHLRIELKHTLRLPSNVTIDGTCNSVELEAPSASRTILAYIASGTENVILTRLTFRKSGYIPGSYENGSAIRANGAFDRVAILHNDLSACGDGCIDITVSPGKPLPPPARVTVAHNLFHDHDEVMLFGTFTCRQNRGLNQCDQEYFRANQDEPPVLFLTLHGNAFVRTGQRHPRVFGRVMAHITNNIIAFSAKRQRDGQIGSTYGVFVSNAARALVAGNVIGPLDERRGRPPLAIWTVKTPGALRMPTDTEGFVKLYANVIWGGAIADEDRPAAVPEPPYRLDEVEPSVLPADDVIRCILERAGPTGTATWNSSRCQRHAPCGLIEGRQRTRPGNSVPTPRLQ